MSSAAGPSIATSGLVLDLDMSNTRKSWKGAPTTNYYKYSATFDDFSYANRTIVTDYLPDGTYSSCLINTFDQASGSRFFIDFTANSNGVYTCSYWVKLVGGSTATNTTLNVKDYQTDVVRGTSGTITLTSSWQRISATGATSGATAGLRFEINVNTSGAAAKIQLYGGQVEQLLFASPLVPTSGAIASRSTTQAIVDLTGNNTLTATSLTYASDNTFSFNGTSNYIDVTGGGLVSGMGAYTIMHWSRRDIEGRMPVASLINTAFYQYGDNSWKYMHGGVSAEYYYPRAVSIPLGTYGFYCIVYNGANVSIYRNGVFEGSQATTGTADWSQGLKIGNWSSGSAYSYSGAISSVSFYNRALSAAEVQQNFNATRSRYGI